MEEFIEREQFLTALQAKQAEMGRGFQKFLAAETGYSNSYINQIIKGKRGLSFKAMSRIAKALGFTYSEFLEIGKKTGQAPPRSPLLPPTPNTGKINSFPV